MKHSIRNRIKITKTGKILRRPMGLGHNKSKRSGTAKQRKRKKLEVHSSNTGALRKYL